MSTAREIAIIATGAVTPVGLTAASSCAALRAGIARLRELPMSTLTGPVVEAEPPFGGRVPLEALERGDSAQSEAPDSAATIEPDVKRLERLARPAVREVVSQARLGAKRPARVGLYVGLGEHDAPKPVLEAVARAAGIGFSEAEAVARGRAAAFAALELARGRLQEGRIDAALVGGVDSNVRGPAIERMRAAGKLRTAQRPHGVAPGEAAAFLCLEAPAAAAARSATPVALLLASAVADEPTATTEQANAAVGLTNAIRAAVRASPGLVGEPLVVCDLNGERSRAMEWVFALERQRLFPRGDPQVWHPAESIGDVGAASGALSMIVAVQALARGYAEREWVLAWGASETACRGAAVVAAWRGAAEARR